MRLDGLYETASDMSSTVAPTSRIPVRTRMQGNGATRQAPRISPAPGLAGAVGRPAASRASRSPAMPKQQGARAGSLLCALSSEAGPAPRYARISSISGLSRWPRPAGPSSETRLPRGAGRSISRARFASRRERRCPHRRHEAALLHPPGGRSPTGSRRSCCSSRARARLIVARATAFALQAAVKHALAKTNTACSVRSLGARGCGERGAGSRGRPGLEQRGASDASVFSSGRRCARARA